MNREILKLAIPNIISNISVPLLSAVDTALMGHLSPMYLGAIGLSTMLFNFMYWNFGFLRMGTTGMVAQAHGAGNHDLVNSLLIKSLKLSLVLAIAVMILSPWLLDMLNAILLIEDTHQEAVSAYYAIRIFDAPATLGLYVLIGWFFGRQDAVVPLVLTVIINLFNIVLSYILVHYYGLAIAGVAWGTVMSQYIGLAILLTIYFYRHGASAFRFSLRPIVSDIKVGAFFTVNSDLFIRTICLTISFLLIYRYSNSAGSTILAANVIILQLISWISFGIDGFAYAAESVVGKYNGAQESKQLMRAVSLCLKWGFLLACGFSSAYLFFLDPIVRIYTADYKVIAEVMSVELWIVLIPIFGFLCYIYDGIYIGLLQTRFMRNSMILSLILFMLMLVSLGDLGNNYLWISFSMFLFFRGLALYLHWSSRIVK